MYFVLVKKDQEYIRKIDIRTRRAESIIQELNIKDKEDKL